MNGLLTLRAWRQLRTGSWGRCTRIALSPLVALLWLAMVHAMSAATSPAPAAAARRLAIVPREPDLQEVADLLTVQFSSQPDLELVERSEIQKALHELGTAARNPATELQLGQQLGAEGLLTLARSTENGQTQLLARVVAVRPGIVLSATFHPWPLPRLDEFAPAVQADLTPLVPKLGVPARDAVPISVMNLRSAVQSRSGHQLEKALTLLLVHRLTRQPEVFVLERQRLDELAAEKELKGLEPAPFWNGRYLIEGTIDRDGFNPAQLTIHLRLTGPNQSTPIQVEASGPRSEPGQVIDRIARTLMTRLGRSEASLATWDAPAEAARFVTEGRWALRWSAFEQARWAAESAWALDNRSLAAAQLRVEALCAPWNTGPGTLRIDESVLQFSYDRVYPKALDPLALALEHFASATAWLDATAVANPTNRWVETGVTALSHAANHLSRFVWADPTTPEVAEPLERLRAAARQAQRIVLQNEERPTPATYNTPAGRSLWTMKCTLGWLWEEGPEAVLEEYTRLLDGELSDTQRRDFLFRDGRRPPLPAWRATDRANTEQRWAAYLDARIALPDPARSVYARLIRHQFTPTSLLVEEPRGTYTRAVQPLLQQLATLGPGFACDHPALFDDALRVIGRRQNFLWEPPPGMTITNVVRDFRTNLVHQWAATGTCLPTNALSVLFRASDYTSPHLRTVLQLVRDRTGSDPGQVPRFKQALFRAYLNSSYERISSSSAMVLTGLYRPEVFELLFNPADYDAAEGAQVLTDLQRFRNQHRAPGDPMARSIAALESRLSELSRAEAAANPGRITIPPATPKAAPTQGSLRVTQWLPLPSPAAKSPLPTDLRVIDARHRDGTLWVEARLALHTNGNLSLPRDSRSVLYRIDLPSLTVKQSSFTAAVPALGEVRMWSQLERTFEVLGQHAYVSWRDQILRAPTDLSDWKPVAIPADRQSSLFAVAGRLYVGSTDRLLEFNPDTGETRVMASTRRRPAEGPLDEMNRFQNPLFVAGARDGSIVHVLIGSRIHPWLAAKGQWGEPFDLPQRPSPTVACSTEDTVLFRSSFSSWEPQTLHRLTAGTPLELLLEGPPTGPGGAYRPGPGPTPGPRVTPRPGTTSGPIRMTYSTSSRSTPATKGTARWKTPEGWNPFVANAALEPGRVWLLHRRVISGPQQDPTLALFTDDQRDPVTLRLEFNRPNPFPEDETRLMGAHPLLVATPSGLILTGRLWPGLWFIPRADLDAALASAKPATSP